MASRPKLTRATWSLSKREANGRRQRDSANRQPSSADAGRALDSLAREAIDRCAGLIALGGYSPEESAQRFRQRSEQVFSAVGNRARTPGDIDLNAHVLTLWSQEQAYLLPDGQMRPLRASGPSPSIEALVNMVGCGLILKNVIAGLLKSGSIRREGRMYLPSDNWVAHPSNSASQRAHHMRVFVEFLRTLDHNRRARRKEQRWFQFAADNTAVPASQFAALNRYLRRTGHAFLRDKDLFMYRMARNRKDDEPTVPVTIGLYLSQPRQGSSRRSTRKMK